MEIKIRNSILCLWLWSISYISIAIIIISSNNLWNLLGIFPLVFLSNMAMNRIVGMAEEELKQRRKK